MTQLISFNNIILDKDIYIMECVQNILDKLTLDEIQFVLDTVSNTDVGYHITDGVLRICTPHEDIVKYYAGDFERIFTIMKKHPYCTKPIIDKLGDRIELIPLGIQASNLMDVVNMTMTSGKENTTIKIIYKDMLEYTLLKQLLPEDFDGKIISYVDIPEFIENSSSYVTMVLDDYMDILEILKGGINDNLVDIKVCNMVRNLVGLMEKNMGEMITHIL